MPQTSIHMPTGFSQLSMLLSFVAILLAMQPTHAEGLDVLHYTATLEPDIAAKSVKGTVSIRFVTDAPEAEFNCGDLTVDSVRFITPDVAIADGPYVIAPPGGAAVRRMWTTIVVVRGTDGWRISAIRNMVPTAGQ